MESGTSTWVRAIACAGVVAGTFVDGCSLDDRSIAERGSEANMPDASGGSRYAEDGGSSYDCGRAMSNRPRPGGEDGQSAGGAGGGGSGVGGGSGGGGGRGGSGGGGEAPMPAAPDDGPDEDAGDRPDGSE